MIGLTGGIATGKSTVAQRLRTLGAVVLDADVLAREVVEPHTPGWERVKRVSTVIQRFDHRPQTVGADCIWRCGGPQKTEAIIHPEVISTMRTQEWR